MKEHFRDAKLSNANLERLDVINDIIEEYQDDGYVLTLRQLYYQLVSRDIIPNCQKEYAKLSTLLKEGRMSGVVDWEAIEDRVRVPFLPYWVDDLKDALSDTVEQYRLDRQAGQPYYIEVWIEKDALANVLRRVTKKYHINLMVNRGYSSCTAMFKAAERFKNAEKPGVLLYMGDHDPSGLDMVRDIAERLSEFDLHTSVYNEPYDEADTVVVNQIALTTPQVKKYQPPPNPAKITDPRAKTYIAEHGRTSWELDALPPQQLIKLASSWVEKFMDMETFEKQVAQEKKDIAKLRSIVGM